MMEYRSVIEKFLSSYTVEAGQEEIPLVVDVPEGMQHVRVFIERVESKEELATGQSETLRFK